MANGKGIAYVGLILGLIGAGLGGYVFFDYQLAPLLGLGEPTLEEGSKVTSWFANDYYDTLSSTGVYELLSDLVISFNTTELVSLYIIYTGYVKFSTAFGTEAYIQLRLNNTIIIDASYYVAIFGATPDERYDVTIQSFIPNLLPGIYNITVWAEVDHISTTFYLNTLYAQSHT